MMTRSEGENDKTHEEPTQMAKSFHSSVFTFIFVLVLSISIGGGGAT